MIEPPILFLCGHRKGGTTMLNNLFDGHSQLSVYPVDINLLYGYFPKFNQSGASEQDLLKRIQAVVFKDIAKLPQLAGIVDFKKLEANFLTNMEGCSFSDMSAVLPALLNGYADLNASTEHQYLVAKETSIELYAKEIAGWLPNCRFIHLIRDPRDNFAAIKAGITKKYASYGDSEISLMFSVIVRNLWGIKMARVNQKLLGNERYRILRFEDLVAAPESTMREISTWLGIAYEESMLQPSICGRPTGGNSFENKTFSGISSEHVGKWKERISDEEAAMIEFAFSDEMAAYGYAAESDDNVVADSVSAFYKSINYKYFYFDRFGE